ncbi:MAG TPA: haloacid dehalogenase-like hydrolase [Roseiflexaceae bacterium]|nr:haloacid dehalogenase-like hydrolase [Roseiflexaceae bacterium]HMP42148.1 haloacid dehalogenase-like hydrolase [Roseiflexaceae bacterium]
MKLLLWDIDGTLLYFGGIAGEAMRQAMTEVYGRPSGDDRRSYAGKTDQQIIIETFPDRDPNQLLAQLPQFAAIYMQVLEARADELYQRGGVLAGAAEALAYMHKQPVVQALLTGNLRPVAELKLRLVGLTGFFDFDAGAYGSDHHRRNELPAIAAARAQERYRHRFHGADLVVIGDTPNDIACGRHAGARTVAVASGPFSSAELQAHAPDALLADLCDPQAVARAILGRQ